MNRESSNKKVLDEKDRKLFVVCLPYDITTEHLRDYFIQFGYIEDVRIIKDKEDGSMRGFGFILFYDRISCIRVFELGDYHVICGKQVRVALPQVECRRVLLRDELQNMQGNQAITPQENVQESNHIDPELMNNMMMQFAHMQGMLGGGNTQSWEDMSMSNNTSSFSQQGYSQNQYYMAQPSPHTMMQSGFNMNHAGSHYTGSRGSAGSPVDLDDDNWSTRPRAKVHISKMDLMYISEENLKKPKLQGNFDANILKSVEGLLDDEPEIYKYDSGFQNSNFLSINKNPVRSVENSGFGGSKFNSGWSDTTASKLNKTRASEKESTPNRYSKITKSFGDPANQESKNMPELSTIFENKDGLFFAWNRIDHQTNVSGASKIEPESYTDGFKIVSDHPPVSTRHLTSTGAMHSNKVKHQNHYHTQSMLYGQSKFNPSTTKSKKKENSASFQQSED